MEQNSKIFVAGHRGMVGSAIVRKLKASGFNRLIFRTSQELDLRDQAAVTSFFEQESPEYVFLAAAKVGGILANDSYRGEFIYDNLMMETNVIHASYVYGVRKLLFMGSSCIYPKLAPQPLKEEYLLSGLLESTNEPYAIAKIAGIKLCEAYRDQFGCSFISLMPSNLYGPNDNYNLQSSHVLPALLRKFHQGKVDGAPEVVVWGSGKPLREFLHVDDLADASVYLMENYNERLFVNVGSGREVSIQGLAEMISEIVGYKGKIAWDTTKPDGTPRKLLDSTRLMDFGWTPRISLEDGVKAVYELELKNNLVGQR